MMGRQQMELSETDVGKKHHVVISKKNAVLVSVFALLLILTVGLLSGILAAKQARKDADEKYESKRDKSTGALTTESLPSSVSTTMRTFAPSSKSASTVLPTGETTSNVSTTMGGSASSSESPSTMHPTVWTTPVKDCADPWCSVRLPTNLVPYHYNLDVRADIGGLRFSGVSAVYVTVVNATGTILVHIKEMNILSCTITNLAAVATPVRVEKQFPFPENEYYVIQTASELKPGKYIIALAFQANISTVLTGFYKSSYQDGGNTKVLFTTKFQPTDARKAYPCFDEPDLKATFKIAVDHPNTHHARANMPGTTRTLDSTWQRTEFSTSVPMSTYLVCFIVSDFQSKHSGFAGVGNNVTVAIWSRPEFVNSTYYAFEAGSKMLTFFENFTSVPYVMPKLDMFAIPDYGSGATEHWGIITYREARLLYSPGVSSQSSKQSSAAIIAHECAHLWFGNLVTCSWWNDLWVQEGMSSYLEYYATDYVHPDWDMMDSFINVDWKTGMDLDALASSHPISQPVDHPKQIKEIFDAITYNKGSSLFQMLDYFLGPKIFKQGLTNYLTDHMYRGATVDDLWASFSKASGLDVKAMMDTWTHQMGYPVISVVHVGDSTVQVSQKHFLLDPKAVVSQPSKFNYQWIIPFTYASSDNFAERKTFVMKSQAANISIPDKTWIIGNFMHKGFYRVNYEQAHWSKIISQLDANHQLFAVSDRAGIIDDVFNLARAGLLDYRTALSATKFLANEESYFVWSMALMNIDYLDNVLSGQQVYTKFRAYMIKILNPMVAKVGMDTDGTTGHIAKFKQLMFIRAACAYGHDSTMAKVRDLFSRLIDNGTSVPADLKSTVYRYGVAGGGDLEWDYVFKAYMNSTNPSEKSMLQGALSATEKPWLLKKWLSLTLDASYVRTQDTAYVVASVAANNPVGRYVAWDFVRSNWPALMRIASANNFHVAHLTSEVTSQFTTEFDLQQVTDFWKQYPDAGAGARARAQGIERIQANIDWIGKHYSTIDKWFSENI